MRLTLRTLLAYLDNTLDAQDAEALKNKLNESSFATQLVERIRKVLGHPSLSAPSPDAIGPVEEANMISEYLDSTLPVEQVAEIERACLESDAHLAEAAGCHQILTIVLKEPAEVPQELRRRIYQLPEQQLAEIAASGSFSGVAIPADEPGRGVAGEFPTSVETGARDAKPIQPVGPDDSGVSDAPTRLRQSEVGLPANGSQAAIAGARPRSVDADTRIYGGSIRPSRITPWLVSLGLTAVLLFVLAQLFQPLFERPMAEVDEPAVAASSAADVEASTDRETVQVEEDTEPTPPSDREVAGEDVGAGESVARTVPAASDQPASASESTAAETSGSEKDVTASADGEAAPPVPDAALAETPRPQPAAAEVTADEGGEEKDATATDSVGRVEGTSPAADGQAGETAAAMTEPDGQPSQRDDQAAQRDDQPADAADQPAGDRVAQVPPPPAAQPPGEGEAEMKAELANAVPDDGLDHQEMAKLSSDPTLVTARVGSQWIRLRPEAVIFDGVPLFCAPTFRAPLTVPGATVTLVGPARVQWVVTEDDQRLLLLDFGRMLVRATEPNVSMPIQMGEETIELQLAEPESTVALEVSHVRTPGLDPLVEENRIAVTDVILVEGEVAVQSDPGTQQLSVGQHRRRLGNAAPEVAELTAMPTWIEPSEAPLEASARSGLLELIDGRQPLELQLREATMFRRSEVAALAGRTLLGMGQADVYFGGDGLFNEPKQRTYWPEHFDALLKTVDRSAPAAERVHDSIVRMDSANASAILRLLTGFSQKQLEQGADKELVESLDSPSMTVRVLALENLQRITGTTLYFRPDQENAVRRAPVIKKWEARLRKQDIRWQE